MTSPSLYAVSLDAARAPGTTIARSGFASASVTAHLHPVPRQCNRRSINVPLCTNVACLPHAILRPRPMEVSSLTSPRSPSRSFQSYPSATCVHSVACSIPPLILHRSNFRRLASRDLLLQHPCGRRASTRPPPGVLSAALIQIISSPTPLPLPSHASATAYR